MLPEPLLLTLPLKVKLLFVVVKVEVLIAPPYALLRVTSPEYNCTPEVVMGPAIFEVPVIVSDDTPALLTIDPYISIKLPNV